MNKKNLATGKVVYMAAEDGKRYRIDVGESIEVCEMAEEDVNAVVVDQLTAIGVHSASTDDPGGPQDERFAQFGTWFELEVASIHYLNLGVTGNPKKDRGGCDE